MAFGLWVKVGNLEVGLPQFSGVRLWMRAKIHLLELFHRKTDLTAEGFLGELRRQRNSLPIGAQAGASV